MSEFLREVSCSNCNALCCRAGMHLPLSADEASVIKRTTPVTEVKTPKDAGRRPLKFLPIVSVTTPAEDGVYRMNTDCGYLQVDNETSEAAGCGIYDNPERPSICGDFKVGSLAGLELRLQAGVDTQEQHDLAIARTAG